MRLDLSEIATHLGKRIRYEIEEPSIGELEGGLECVSPVKGEATFTNTGTLIVARGSFRTTVALDCSRCLSRIKMDLDLPIEEGLPISGHVPEIAKEEEVEELPEEVKEPLFQDNTFDLTEMLRQSILVAVPIKPLCSEECKGLCQHCGKNLTEGPCDCPLEEEPSAFGALAPLLEEKEDEES